MSNKLVVIGYQGGKYCYLNMPKEEAIKLYNEANKDTKISIDDPDISVIEFEFDNVFAAYDAYPIGEA